MNNNRSQSCLCIPWPGSRPPGKYLVNIPRLITAYFMEHPEEEHPDQRVAFGTSGHRGSSFKKSYNEDHILAVTQAICDYREANGITGPLFLGYGYARPFRTQPGYGD